VKAKTILKNTPTNSAQKIHPCPSFFSLNLISRRNKKQREKSGSKKKNVLLTHFAPSTPLHFRRPATAGLLRSYNSVWAIHSLHSFLQVAQLM
jgi:hypothetical protein